MTASEISDFCPCNAPKRFFLRCNTAVHTTRAEHTQGASLALVLPRPSPRLTVPAVPRSTRSHLPSPQPLSPLATLVSSLSPALHFAFASILRQQPRAPSLLQHFVPVPHPPRLPALASAASRVGPITSAPFPLHQPRPPRCPCPCSNHSAPWPSHVYTHSSHTQPHPTLALALTSSSAVGRPHMRPLHVRDESLNNDATP